MMCHSQELKALRTSFSAISSNITKLQSDVSHLRRWKALGAREMTWSCVRLFKKIQCVHDWGVLTVGVKARCSIEVVSGAFGIFAVNFRTKCLFWHVHVHFDFAGSHKSGVAGLANGTPCKFPHKMALVKCPCTFRPRRLAQSVLPGLEIGLPPQHPPPQHHHFPPPPPQHPQNHLPLIIIIIISISISIIIIITIIIPIMSNINIIVSIILHDRFYLPHTVWGLLPGCFFKCLNGETRDASRYHWHMLHTHNPHIYKYSSLCVHTCVHVWMLWCDVPWLDVNIMYIFYLTVNVDAQVNVNLNGHIMWSDLT